VCNFLCGGGWGEGQKELFNLIEGILLDLNYLIINV
jgi:hypothetical protein